MATPQLIESPAGGSAMTRPDDALIDLARRGDERAWSRIVTELGPSIRGYARARGIRDPEDVTQDVFVAASARIHDFTGDWKSFRSWLFSIAYRQIVNRYRSDKRHGGEIPTSLADPNPEPAEVFEAQAEQSEAVAAMVVLNDLERDVVLLRVIGELDTEAVANAVGKRPGTVRVIQSRAMSKLRDELELRGYGRGGSGATNG